MLCGDQSKLKAISEPQRASEAKVCVIRNRKRSLPHLLFAKNWRKRRDASVVGCAISEGRRNQRKLWIGNSENRNSVVTPIDPMNTRDVTFIKVGSIRC